MSSPTVQSILYDILAELRKITAELRWLVNDQKLENRARQFGDDG